MMLELSIVLLLCSVFVTPVPMTVYSPAQFHPTNATGVLASLSSIITMNDCVCRCYNQLLCITGNYFGMNQTCVLFSAKLQQGQLRLITDRLASVFSFPNRTTELDSISPPAIMEWLFDRNFNDVYSIYHGYFISNDIDVNESSDSLWVSPGYNGYGNAVHFLPNTHYVVNQYFTLTEISFTMSAWISITFNFTSQSYDYFSLFSHCSINSDHKCLHLVIGKNYLRLGFFGDDLVGTVTINPNQWYHVAYVYDRSTLEQRVYLNGFLQQSRISVYPYAGDASQIILGPIPLISTSNFHSGYIDQLIFVTRIKNDAELLDEATLVAYYPFDDSYVDAGPNNINSTTYVSTTFDSAGRLNQALVFNSIAISYFQTTGFYFLGQSNYSYSFALWIYPFANNGTILQVSSSNGWCVPMIGFNQGGYLTIQTLGNKGLYSITQSFQGLSLNAWTHITMTYSLTSGIRLFVNGVLTDGENSFVDYKASGDMCTITIGSGLEPNACVVDQTTIVPLQFRGKIDELKIFSRELTNNEVYQLMRSSETS